MPCIIRLARIGCIVLMMAYASTSLAQDLAYFAEEDFFGEAPVVLTVSRLHKPLAESPVSVSVIDRQMIRASGARRIEDIFRMVPGFLVSNNPYDSNTGQVFYQGMGEGLYRQFQMLIDGRSVFIPSFGGIPWNNLPIMLNDIERVEITRGPNAVTYGANAFLATINVITRHAAEDSGVYASILQDINSDNETSDVYLRAGNQVGDIDWRLTAGRLEDDGLINQHDSNLNNYLTLRTDMLLRHNQFLTLQAGVNWTTKQRGEDGVINDVPREKIVTNGYQNIKWEHIGNGVSSTVKFSHAQQRVNDAFNSLRLNEFISAAILGNDADIIHYINFDRDSKRLDLEAFQNRTLNDSTKINYGFSLRRDSVDSFYLFNDFKRHNINTRRLFSNLEWKASQDLIVDAGIMMEKTSYTDWEPSTRLSLIKGLGNHHFRGVYSTANRNPILWELIGLTQFEVTPLPASALPFDTFLVPQFIGSTDFEPEQIESFEVGILSELMNNQLTTDVRLFQSRLSNQMDVDFNGNVNVNTSPNVLAVPASYDLFTNRGKTDIDGLEVSVNYSPDHERFRWYSGFSLQNVASQPEKIGRSFPERSGYMGGLYNITEKHQVSGLIYRVSELRMIDASGSGTPSVPNPTNGVMKAYTKLDLRYQYLISNSKDTRLEIIRTNQQGEYDSFGNGFQQEPEYWIKLSSRL